MVSSHIANHHHTDVYANVMQSKVLASGHQLPKIIWNQIEILIIANKDGEE